MVQRRVLVLSSMAIAEGTTTVNLVSGAAAEGLPSRCVWDARTPPDCTTPPVWSCRARRSKEDHNLQPASPLPTYGPARPVEIWGSDTFHATTSRRAIPDYVDLNRAKEILHQGRASSALDHPHEPTGRHLAAAMRIQASATSTAGSPRHARAQWITTGPRGPIITLSGCRSKWRRRTRRPTGASTIRVRSRQLMKPRWRSASVRPRRGMVHGRVPIIATMSGPSMRSITMSKPSALTSSTAGTGKPWPRTYSMIRASCTIERPSRERRSTR